MSFRMDTSCCACNILYFSRCLVDSNLLLGVVNDDLVFSPIVTGLYAKILAIVSEPQSVSYDNLTRNLEHDIMLATVYS